MRSIKLIKPYKVEYNVKLALPQTVAGAQKPSGNKDHKRKPAITISELTHCDQMTMTIQVNYEVIWENILFTLPTDCFDFRDLEAS